MSCPEVGGEGRKPTASWVVSNCSKQSGVTGWDTRWVTMDGEPEGCLSVLEPPEPKSTEWTSSRTVLGAEKSKIKVLAELVPIKPTRWPAPISLPLL